jgi:hypothetical protein
VDVVGFAVELGKFDNQMRVEHEAAMSTGSDVPVVGYETNAL